MSNSLQKGGKTAAIGTRKEFGGREYIKTGDGWKFVGKGKGKGAQKHLDAHKSSPTDDKKSTTHSPEELTNHAANTPTEKLTAVAHDKDQPKEMQQAAQQELDHRQKGGEEVEKQHDSPKEEEKEEKSKDSEKREDSKETHEKRGFDESKGDEDVTGKRSDIAKEDKGLPNHESAVESHTLAEKNGPAKLNEQKEGFSVKSPEILTTSNNKPSDNDDDDDDINHKFEAFGRFAAGVIKGRMKSLIAYGSGGVGKSAVNTARIYTPNNYTTHGQVQPGDVVLNAEGQETTVLQIHPQGKIEVFRVKLADRTVIDVSKDHLWKVWDKTGYWDKDLKKRVAGGRWVVMTTQQILDKGVQLRKESISNNGNKIWPEWRFLIPYTKPAQHTTKNQLIDSYELGYIIGDGSITQQNIRVTVGIEDQSHFNKSFEGYQKSGSSDIDFDLKGERSSKIREGLKFYHLHGKTAWDKFIPQEYLYGNVQQRLSLIQGLMDTDGTVGDKNGVLTYYTVSERLAEDFLQLVKSFGMKATKRLQKRKFSGNALNHNIEQNKDRISEIYEINFQLPQEYNPFRNERKLNKYLLFKRRDDIRGQAIVEIIQIEDQECTCITVSDAESLYLTEGYTVTHNTYTVTTELEKAGKKIFDPELHDAGDTGYDYVKMTGKMTAAAVYSAMYEHNGKILLFDDCDSVLQDDNAINLFKGALDTSGDGSIDWGSKVKLKDSLGQEIPGKFAFNGRAIFISNLNVGKDVNGKQQNAQLQPIVSRGYSLNLTMDAAKTMERIEHISTGKDGKMTNLKFPGTPNYTHEDMKAVLDYMKKHKDKASDLNVRTVGTLLAIKKDADEAGVKWEDDAKYVYLRKSSDIDIYNGAIFNRQKQSIEKALGVDDRTIQDKKIDWCTIKKASLIGKIKSAEFR